MKLAFQNLLRPLAEIGLLLREHLRFDWIIGIISLGFCAFLIPLIPRATENAQQLANFVNDEPALTMALDGMTVRPYGNPARYYWAGVDDPLPEHWGRLRYGGFFYYGGVYLDLGFAVFLPLKKLFGVATFPAAPIILRTISLVMVLLTLVVAYNIAKRLAGKAAGLLAIVIILTDIQFLYYATIIHPDTTQLFLTLLVVLTAWRHIETRTWSSLIALGILAGLHQGTKCGGPWLMPGLALALCGGVPSSAPWLMRIRQLGLRTACLGGVSIAAFLASTPYALLDPYYRGCLREVRELVTRSNLTAISIVDWLSAIWLSLGWFITLAFGVGVVAVVMEFARHRRLTLPFVAIVFAASSLAWFLVMGRLWVMVGYMLPCFVLLAICAGAAIARSFQRLGTWHWARSFKIATVSVLVILISDPRVARIAGLVASSREWRQNTVYLLNRWADGAIPHSARIVSDTGGGLEDPRFSRFRMLGHVLKHVDLSETDAEYFILNSALFESTHYRGLICTQERSRDDRYPFSVRLYQDLLGKDIDAVVRQQMRLPVGPTVVPGIDFVASISPYGTFAMFPDLQSAENPMDYCTKLFRFLHRCFVPQDVAWGQSYLVFRVRPEFHADFRARAESTAGETFTNTDR